MNGPVRCKTTLLKTNPPPNPVEPTLNPMKTLVKPLRLLCTLLLCLAAIPLQAQLSNLTCGAVSTNVGSQLKFVNSTNYDSTLGKTYPLFYTLVSNLVAIKGRVLPTGERTALANLTPYYLTTNLLFSSLSSVTNATNGGAAKSAYLVCEVVSVTGPSGGIFQFWEQGDRVPTYVFPVGVTPTMGSNRFMVSDISQGAGQGGGDAFGSIRGRRYSVNKPGDYVVGFKLYDTSTNSLAMGPLHTPSDVLTIKFTTAFNPSTMLFSGRGIVSSNSIDTLTFQQGGLTNFYIDMASDLTISNWTVAAGPFTVAPWLNNSQLVVTQRFTNASSPNSARFYRLRGSIPTP
jgi:hypothetical protein